MGGAKPRKCTQCCKRLMAPCDGEDTNCIFYTLIKPKHAKHKPKDKNEKPNITERSNKGR